MEENKENVVEETTQKNQQDPTKENVVKVDLNKPPTPKEEKNETKKEVKEDNANDSGVVAESENAEPTQEQKEVQPEAETQEAPALEATWTGKSPDTMKKSKLGQS